MKRFIVKSPNNRYLFTLFDAVALFATVALILLFFGGCGNPQTYIVKGHNSLVLTSNSAPNCTNGGVTISSGLDSNDNGVLDANEISSTNEVCDGENGEDGEDGKDCKSKKKHKHHGDSED